MEFPEVDLTNLFTSGLKYASNSANYAGEQMQKAGSYAGEQMQKAGSYIQDETAKAYQNTTKTFQDTVAYLESQNTPEAREQLMVMSKLAYNLPSMVGSVSSNIAGDVLNIITDGIKKLKNGVLTPELVITMLDNKQQKQLWLLIATLCLAVLAVSYHMFFKYFNTTEVLYLFLLAQFFIILVIDYLIPYSTDSPIVLSSVNTLLSGNVNELFGTYNARIEVNYMFRYGAMALVLMLLFSYTHGQTMKYLNNSVTLLLVVYTAIGVLMANGAYHLSY